MTMEIDSELPENWNVTNPVCVYRLSGKARYDTTQEVSRPLKEKYQEREWKMALLIGVPY